MKKTKHENIRTIQQINTKINTNKYETSIRQINTNSIRQINKKNQSEKYIRKAQQISRTNQYETKY